MFSLYVNLTVVFISTDMNTSSLQTYLFPWSQCLRVKPKCFCLYRNRNKSILRVTKCCSRRSKTKMLLNFWSLLRIPKSNTDNTLAAILIDIVHPPTLLLPTLPMVCFAVCEKVLVVCITSLPCETRADQFKVRPVD